MLHCEFQAVVDLVNDYCREVERRGRNYNCLLVGLCIEQTLLVSDLGPKTTLKIVDALKFGRTFL